MRVPWVTGVECQELGTGTRHAGAWLSAISLSRVVVHGVPALPEGTRVRLRLSLPSLNMALTAVVVRSTPGGGLGLGFRDLTPVHQAVIQALMKPAAAASAPGTDEPHAGSAQATPQSVEALELPPVGAAPSASPSPAAEDARAEAAPAPALQPEDSLPPLPPLPSRAPHGGAPDAEVGLATLLDTPAEPQAAAPSDAEAAPGRDESAWLPPLPPLPDPPPLGAAAADRPDAGAAAERAEASEPAPAASAEPSTPPAAAGEGDSAHVEPVALALATAATVVAAAPAPTPAPAKDPAPAAVAVAERDAVTPRKAGGPPHVLVVDDHARTRSMLRGMIEGRGKAFDVTEACDGEDCLRIVSERPPFDLIFLDVDMPRKNGLETCKELRARGVRSPIIFLTGRSEGEDFRAGREAGADTYIRKPIVLGTLRSVLSLFTSGSLQRR